MSERFDALSRIGPVARPLLDRVDAALLAHGAPQGHRIWAHLRRLGTTPADAVAFFVDADAAPLRAVAGRLRGEVAAFRAAPAPTQVRWTGSGAETYAARATAVRDHTDAMTGRLAATASFADDVAAWWDESRAAVAAALAEVLTSAQAITVTTGPATVTTDVLRAAADIGAHVLDAVAAAHEAGHGLLRGGADLGELPFAPGADPQRRVDATVDVHH
ncbi:hypothetical protein [Luedemannella helvata]|uniref:Uncharacterized protein n=1 Tax=Luedemannella helvata TaxID=349315 RepID=A0ABP4WSE8_9ACTN